MRASSATALTQVSARSGYPVGGCAPYKPSPISAAYRASAKPARASTWPPTARTALATYSKGFLIFARRGSGAQNSGEVTSARSIALMSPSVARNVAATRSTSAGGGSSETKRRTSLVAMKRAVAG